MAELLHLLRTALDKPAANFRSGQEEAIRAALEPPFRALVVQATGWGKSMVYFVATKVLRDRGRGPTLVVSPLLSLMRDQVRAASRLGLVAEQLTSENRDEWDELIMRLVNDEVDLLLISPERLANQSFGEVLTNTSLSRAGLLVVDEAHCISDWGHDFRPDYQRLGAFVRSLPKSTAILATTATANDRVIEDIRAQIGAEFKVLRGSLARKSLRIQVVTGFEIGERLAWIADHLGELPGSGIIYALTKLDCERLCKWLLTCGHRVRPYHAGLPSEERRDAEQALLNNEVKALVATVALGMGFDKPDIGFAVHFQSPGNLVAYYQQIGRAGRAVRDSFAILFLGEEDDEIHDWFLEHARPSESAIRQVLDALDVPRSMNEIERLVNLRHAEIENVLKCLSILTPSPVAKVGPKYQLTTIPYKHDPIREEALKQQREGERARFLAFASTTRCYMQVVREELNDPLAAPCGQCSNCVGQPLVPLSITQDLLQRAMDYLNRSTMPIFPRRLWPVGGLRTYGFTGKIKDEEACAVGICLCHWGDPGFGRMVRDDKRSRHFRQELVDHAASILREQQSFDGVAYVPTLEGNLVRDFAERLAAALNVPCLNVTQKVKRTIPQKVQQNSAHQALNLDGAFEVTDLVKGRLLLVDDMVDSRWTLTILGALLRRHGASEVVPFALASTAGAEDV
ncbi:MAG TPA: RecQ family ATP-dependent DNA helicase [Fimbriimonadaceae bacterium]|nr:RecQ family ATP-dependent DNA helicase [Fimbriimonadaceae bacterium]